MTTQQVDIKASLRIGRMFNGAGEVHHFELAVMNRKTHYVVSLEIFKGAHEVKNSNFTLESPAPNVEAARKLWQDYQAYLNSNYSVVSFETSTKVLGQEYKDTKWEAAPAGGV